MINESHILAEAAGSGKSKHYSGADISMGFDPIGKARLKALDSRLKSVGARTKEQKQKTPMNIQKGIIAKQKAVKERVEIHAKQAGIILARPGKPSGITKKKARRDRGLKIAAVGKNTKHGLIISQREIAKFTSNGKSGGRLK